MEKERNLFNEIAKANDQIKTIELKGKNYCEVKERVIAFRKVYPDGSIRTEETQTDNYIKVKAIILNNASYVIATGTARELANKPFALENCETSAVGRALGFCGFGIKSGIASKEDMENIDSPSGAFDEVPSQELLDSFNKLTNTQKANILNLNHTTDPKTIKASVLEVFINNAK